MQERLKIRIGTRGSRLAIVQTEMVIAALSEHAPQVETEIVRITTSGDRSAPFNVAMAEGKADFVKEIEAALLEGAIDAAVHSLKDLPVNLPDGLALAACLPRADPADVLVSKAGYSLASLPVRARVGTSSPRRVAMLLHARPDLKVVSIRGNVPTRVRKMEEGEYDAIVLARAGLERLDLLDQPDQRDRRVDVLDEALMLPAPCQGIVGIETRADRNARIWAAINDLATWRVALCERAVVRRLGADCHTPLGVCAKIDGDTMTVWAVLLSPDGRAKAAQSAQGPASEPEQLGERLAEMLIAKAEGKCKM